MKLLKVGLIFILLLAFYVILYKIYIPRIAAFGCFDDCFNIAAGYFINEGKILYKDIFFNHQIIAPYISAFIQNTTSPINIFELILKHRQFVLFFGFIFNFLLLLRFGFKIVPFIFIFELTKFYVFGDRFLAENLVVYPLIYSLNLIWEKINKRKIFNFDYILAAVFSWFVIFAREPFFPVAFILFGIILYGRLNKIKILAILVFIILSLFILLRVPFSDYYFNVFTINQMNFSGDLTSAKLLEAFFYPVYLLLSSESNIFRSFLFVLSSIFIFFIVVLVSRKKYKETLVILLILGLANIRSVTPGRIFYDAFHMVPWYGLFLSSIFLLVFDLKKYLAPVLAVIFLSFLYFVPNSFLTEKTDPHTELIVNYGNFIETGNVIRTLSSSNDTLFLDGYDELIYWDTKLVSPYKYSWYTSLMPNIKIYSDARLEMFEENLPDFYYGSCKQSLSRIMPKDYLQYYQRLSSGDKPTCIYLTKVKISEITEDQWTKIKIENNYELSREVLTEDTLLNY